ncbi:hypothetical protein TWF569_011639 [Orbilia oligospora]|uniref:Uncharacterized protein n=2 Tax=Orbilia oligospora TaxID=2813651 RepID=A0A7C8J9H2_ORBOL|nr:hypothetical protein TWF102_007180 [Orbilia oligospora]KAF3102874.1 hypothetical protein TWF103_007575 [Orbilia oligospora]KAF3113076.1 hypothetical protein TWF706_010078 [Orbilia oligospora]KAF3127034.1 hypothetical protein TWF594_000808 [Orbilia oligospora]KAF3127939.1 hypothetical protein TWF569_011639 [Orbilia oligospora]
MESIIARPRTRSSAKEKTQTMSAKKISANGNNVAVQAKSKRNTPLGVIKLARLHTLESLLCVYPAIWGACLSAGSHQKVFTPSSFLSVLFANWISMTIAHMAFCTFNDIVDRNFDGKVERTKVRPLPAGMISLRSAIIAFIVEMGLTVYISYATLGFDGALVCAPVWIASTIYPFMKRVVQWPQLVLGPIIGMAVFPGWVSVAGNLDTLRDAVPMFLATSAWVVYFDTIYATQDTNDDKKIGVKSLAVLFHNHMHQFLGFLGSIQIALLSFTARKANMSALFWSLGVCVWGLNIPFHLLSLDTKNPKTGGKVFLMNILLGLWITIVCVIELWTTTVMHLDVNDFLLKTVVHNITLTAQNIRSSVAF